MRYVIYALPFMLGLGVVAAGLASWRHLAGKLAIMLGVLALLVAGYTVWRVESVLGQVQEAIESLGSLNEVLGGSEGNADGQRSAKERCEDADPGERATCLADPDGYGVPE